MADNVAVTEGSGKDIATDDVGGKQYQRIKLDLGTDGAAAPALAGAGAVATGVQRVTLASDDPAVAKLGTIDTDTGVIAGDTTSIDGKITACNTGAVVISSGTITTVSTVTAVTSLDKSVYVDDADWADNTSSHTLVGGVYQSSPHTVTDGDVSPFGVDVNGNIVLGTSAKAIGKLAANTGVDIGDVDVTSVIAGVGATNLGKARDSALGATDTGVMALAVRDDTLTTLTPADGDYVPLRVSSTGQLHVTGAGGGTEYTEDVATANPQVGSAIMVERDDALTTVTPVEADWIGLRGTAEGALWVQDFNSDAIAASLSVLDDWDDANYCNVNLNLAGTDAGVGENALDGTELRVTIATDDDGVAHLSTIAGAVAATHMQCDIIAGTVTTVSTVTNLSQLGGTAITMDEGVHDAGCQRVTIATDDDGVLSLGIIDDWDATHDSAASADGPQLMAAYDATKPAAVADGDAVRVLADEYGRLLAGVEKTAWQATLNSADATGAAVVVKASAASTILVIQSYVISSDIEGWAHLVDEDDTVLTGKFWLKAGGGVAITLPDKAPIMMGVDKDLEFRCEAAGDVSVSATGYTIPG